MSLPDNTAPSPNPLERSVELINGSDSMLIFGLENLDMDSQIEAWKLADRCGATIDASVKTSTRGKMFSMQRHGKVTATWGEINQRADVVIFWFSDPASDHLKELEVLTKKKKPGQIHCVINDRPNATTKIADEWLQLDRSDLIDVITGLRMKLKGVASNRPQMNSEESAVENVITRLVEITADKRQVAMFLPVGDASVNSEFDLATESLLRLVTEWNTPQPVTVHSFADRNAAGAEYALAAASGFPFANNLNRQFARFCGNEYSASLMLERQECDAAMVFTTEMVDRGQAPFTEADVLNGFSESAIEYLRTIPVIEIGSGVLPFASVSIPADAIGISGESKVLRGDGVMLDAALLAGIHACDRAKSAQGLLQQLGQQLSDGVASIDVATK